MVSDNSRVDEAQNASIHSARTSLERIRFNIAATADSIENINSNLDAIEQRRFHSTQKENELVASELVSEEIVTEEVFNTSEQIQFERTQTVAPIVAEILKVVGQNPFSGQKHTVYWDELDQLVLVRNSDGAQLMKVSYNSLNSQWEPVEPSHLTEEIVQHFIERIPQIESRRSDLQQEKSNESLNRQRGFSR